MLRTIYKPYLILLLALAFSFNKKLQAQDIHFSQNYATPLLINPGMTGLMNGDVRIAAIYRNQWAAIMPGVSFRTMSISADMAFPGLFEKDRFAAGLVLYNDRAGDLNWNTNYVDASLAYNLALATETYLSLGVQGGINQRNFDLNNARFGDQSDGSGFNPNLPTSDIIEAQNRTRLHLGAGAVFYRAVSSRKNIFAGFGMYHLNKPDISVSEAEDRFKNKISAQVGGSFPVAAKWDVLPTAFYIQQGPLFKLDVGSFARYIFSTNRQSGLDKAFNIGVWLRTSRDINRAAGLNALVVAGKVDYENFSLGVSYDITLFTDLTTANNGRGGPEISFVYTGRVRPSRPGALNCPRF